MDILTQLAKGSHTGTKTKRHRKRACNAGNGADRDTAEIKYEHSDACNHTAMYGYADIDNQQDKHC